MTNRQRRGFTLAEILTVMVVMGLMLAVVLPHLHLNSAQQARFGAGQVLRDVEWLRTRALATKRALLVTFDTTMNSYSAYSDLSGQGVFGQTAAEMQAAGRPAPTPLPTGVTFGPGSAGPVPGDAGQGAVTLPNGRLEFNTSGLTVPFGTSGTIYVVAQDPARPAAVTVTGAGSLQLWRYNAEAHTWQQSWQQ